MNSHAAPSGWVRTVGCVTTTRADYGIYRPLLAALARGGRYQVVRFAGGTHLRERFGHTLDAVRADDYGPVVTVDYLGEGDDPAGIAESAGAALAAFGRALAVRPVDLLVILGDRYEMLSAATAALLHRIPIAHLHGGDVTAGAYDDSLRHAITKLAALHFPAIEDHARRIIAMGEQPWRITVTGALALDALSGFVPEPRPELSYAIGLDLSEPTLVVCMHPETLTDDSAVGQFQVLERGLDAFDGNIVVIGPNADEGHQALRSAIEGFTRQRPRTRLVQSLTQSRFWSCLAHAAALVGNSSAGVIESASLKLPTVNVGRRQAGRVHAGNVLDVAWDAARIRAAVARCLDPGFRRGLADLRNPWGDGHAAERIVDAIASAAPRRELLNKAELS